MKRNGKSSCEHSHWFLCLSMWFCVRRVNNRKPIRMMTSTSIKWWFNIDEIYSEVMKRFVNAASARIAISHFILSCLSFIEFHPQIFFYGSRVCIENLTHKYKSANPFIMSIPLISLIKIKTSELAPIEVLPRYLRFNHRFPLHLLNGLRQGSASRCRYVEPFI